MIQIENTWRAEWMLPQQIAILHSSNNLSRKVRENTCSAIETMRALTWSESSIAVKSENAFEPRKPSWEFLPDLNRRETDIAASWPDQ